MTKPIKFDESGDNEDLQALFDSIASGNTVAKPAAAVVVDQEHQLDTSGDSPELQDLFDSIAAQYWATAAASAPSPVTKSAAPAASAPAAAAASSASAATPGDTAAAENMKKVFDKLGKLTRELHDALHEAGSVTVGTARQERFAQAISVAEQLAGRLQGAAQAAMPIQATLRDQSAALGARWDKVFGNQVSPAEFKALAADTHAFLRVLPNQVDATGNQLSEITRAQDAQKSVARALGDAFDLCCNMESQLLAALIDAMPAKMRGEIPEGLLKEGATDRSRAADLLGRLGF